MRKHLGLVIVFGAALLNVAAAPKPKIGSPAPDFVAPTSTGRDLRMSDYQGKVVLLDFWASWCIPCREEMPALVGFYERHRREDFEIIAVNIDDDAGNMRRFLSELWPAPGFPVVADREKQIPALYQIRAMPTTVMVDREGIVRYWHDGFKKSYEQAFDRELEQLLHEEPDAGSE